MSQNLCRSQQCRVTTYQIPHTRTNTYCVQNDKSVALTTIGNNPDGRVSLSEPCDGRQSNQVRLRSDELRQIVSDQFSLLHVSIHRNLLFPPPLLSCLKERNDGHSSCQDPCAPVVVDSKVSVGQFNETKWPNQCQESDLAP